MIMPHGHALVQQTLAVDTVALSTLGSRAAIIINSTLGTGILQSFLVKRVKYLLTLIGKTIVDDGPIAILLNKGDATAAEVGLAMTEINTAGMMDTTQVLTQDNAWTVFQNTVKAFVPRGDGTAAVLDTGWFSIGGKNGIPIQEGQGISAHAFNCGSGALTTGASVNGLILLQGVWLRD